MRTTALLVSVLVVRHICPDPGYTWAHLFLPFLLVVLWDAESIGLSRRLQRMGKLKEGR